jgi:hypothetical protein
MRSGLARDRIPVANDDGFERVLRLVHFLDLLIFTAFRAASWVIDGLLPLERRGQLEGAVIGRNVVEGVHGIENADFRLVNRTEQADPVCRCGEQEV